jgi:oligopeptide transport system permease protein
MTDIQAARSFEDNVEKRVPGDDNGKGKGYSLSQIERRRRSLAYDAFMRFLSNRVGVAASIYIIVITLAAIFAGPLMPYERDAPDFENTRTAPSAEHWFGTDKLGRDVFTRTVYGARVSLGVAFVGTITAMVIGVAYGAISGYFGGVVDDIMMRFVDLMFGFPTLLFIILILLVIPPNSSTLLIMVGLFVALGVVSWLNVARLVRGQFLSLREKEFVEAAEAVGARPFEVVTRHLLPNSFSPVLIWLTLQIPSLILTESTLSFIGLGVKPPTPSWGGMLSEGWRAMRTSPWLAIFPALAISVTMLAFNFLGDSLRDALDPTMRGQD